MNNEELVSRGCERERVDSAPADKRHLTRLAPEFYRGRAFVHWTHRVEHPATGWLSAAFHHQWQLTLLHTCARYELACPVYVLMPDHVHLVWLGLSDSRADQRVATEFLRKHLRETLAPADWQRQSHDHVLGETEREHSAFLAVANYLFENPMRAGLVTRLQDYPFTGCCVAGYPDLNVREERYWELFWRIYNRLVETR